MFSCRMVGVRNVLSLCPEKGRFDPHASLRPGKDVCRLAGPRLIIAKGRYPSILADLISVWHSSCKLTYSRLVLRESIRHPGQLPFS